MKLSKSYDLWFLGLYSEMLKDISEQCQALRVDCERDYNRLLSIVERHGSQFILETLVSYGKHFDKCLSQMRLTRSELPHMGGFRRGGAIPRLFKGIHLRIFDESGALRSEPDVNAIRWLRQLVYCLKSFRISCPESRIYENVREFIRTDGEVRQPSLNWDDCHLDADSANDLQFGDLVLPDVPLFPGDTSVGCRGTHSRTRSELRGLQQTFDILTSIIGRFDPLAWKARHGPGTVSDLRGKAINKYSFPNWSERLDYVFPYAEFAFANYGLWADKVSGEQDGQTLTEFDTPARLLSVPKTYKAPRLIASEPVAHQWCQQVIRDFFTSRVRDTFIHRSIRFNDQTWNGRLAREASLSGSHATIDLSSASDRISCWLVERAFRRSPTLLQALHSCRTRWITQDLDKKSPKVIRLRKFSTMGSAVTFPIQSILFYGIAVAAVLQTRGKPVTQRNMVSAGREVRVFGDDIIVPTDAWPLVSDYLESLGLLVNTDKTFGVGNFRESCGVDAFRGHIVTKVGVLDKPDVAKPGSILSSVDVHNNLLLAGYFRAAAFVRRAVVQLKRYAFPEVCYSQASTGWYTFGEPDNSYLRSRWNPDLHRREYLSSRLTARGNREPTDGSTMLHQYFTECTSSTFISGDRLGSKHQAPIVKIYNRWGPIAA